MKERWKSVVGFEGLYEVSDRGRIKSLKRFAKIRNGMRRVPEIVLKSAPNKDGYLCVTLCRDTKHFLRSIHRLVLEAFVGSCPISMQCRHLDDCKTNNELSNLRWGSPKENCADRYLNGGHVGGEKNGGAKFTNKDVRRIRKDFRYQRVIADEWNVSQSTIHRIKTHKVYVDA